MDATLRRLAPLTGVGFVALYVAGTVITLDGSPDFAGPAEEIAEYYSDDSGRILAGTMVGVIGAPFYIWFLGCLRTAIAKAEGGSTRLASTAFGAGVASLATGLAGLMINAMGALRADEDGQISATAAQTYFDIGQILGFAATPAAVAGLLLATAVASLRYKAILPAWLAYVTIALAIVDVIPPISWIGQMVGLLWALVVSVMLYRQGVTDDAIPPAAATPGPGVAA